MRLSAILVVCLALALACFGCSEDEPTQPPPPPSGTIAVAPPSASVFVHSSQAFVATTGDTADHSVTWRLRRDPALSDTLDVGTIVATGPKSVTYTAPATVENLLGYSLTLQAVSDRDTTVRGTTQIIVPAVQVALVPDHLFSVLPATPVPFNVLVGNTPNKGFTLAVNDIPGGDAAVGTLVATGPASATYTAPARDTTATYVLEARSTDDTRRFGLANVSVRAGFQLPAAGNADQWAPEWNLGTPKLAYVRGGAGAWQLVVYNFENQAEQVLTSFTRTGAVYDGRIAWSDDGLRILFSEEVGGQRKIGVIQANGTERTSFGPQGAIDYEEACFVPLSSDSIYVTQHQGTNWSLRAYPLASGLGSVGRVLYTPPARAEVHSPDAAILEGIRRPFVAFETVVDGDGTVRSLKDDGEGVPGVAYSSATARTEQVRWAFPLDGGEWITFVYGQRNLVYRVNRSGLDLPQPCYVDYFDEASADLKAIVPSYFGFGNPQAVTRRDASGHWRIWVVDFPPSGVIPVSRAQSAGGRVAMRSGSLSSAR
jgi:hypothetical protein